MGVFFNKDQSSTTDFTKKKNAGRSLFHRKKKSENTSNEDKLKHVQAFEKDLERAKVF